MKIIYLTTIDYNYIEDYSMFPKSHGAGPIFARYAKELLNNNEDKFVIICPASGVKNLRPTENMSAFVPLNENLNRLMISGHPLINIIPWINDYDVIVHHGDTLMANLTGVKIPVVSWGLDGEDKATFPQSQYCLLYRPEAVSTKRKFFRIKIGTYVHDDFSPTPKEDFIFQCSRHDETLNSIHVAKFCLENEILCIFAGPIIGNYPLMDFIDNKYTVYFGEINEEVKLGLIKTCRLYTLCQTQQTSFSLSAIESLSLGTPICGPRMGGFKYIIQDGLNGFFWNGENLREIWDKSKLISPKNCWESAKRFSHTEMVASFKIALAKVVKDWNR